jgi:hypothetical protein
MRDRCTQSQLIDQQTQRSSAPEAIAQALLRNKVHETIPKWENPARPSDQLDPDLLDHKYEDHGTDGDPPAIAAQATAPRPALQHDDQTHAGHRQSLARYLGIESEVPVIK